MGVSVVVFSYSQDIWSTAEVGTQGDAHPTLDSRLRGNNDRVHYPRPAMSFFQSPPALGNQYDDDRVLRSLLARVLPARGARARSSPSCASWASSPAASSIRLQLADRQNEPLLTQWDAWGHRVDQIEVSPLWREAQVLAARARHGRRRPTSARTARTRARTSSRSCYLFDPSLDVYSCPLAMTDGAARTLLDSRQPRADRSRRAAPHQPRSGDDVDERPVDDRAHRRLRRRR